jgi:PKD repeat protein
MDQSGDRDGEILIWKWDFGDGKTSTERTPFHRYSDNGIYTISLKATDEDGATNETRKTIKILNTPPTASFAFSPSKPNINEAVTFNAAVSADSDGRIVAYEWDWNNNGRFETRRTSPTISLPFNYCGSYTTVLRVIDNDGATNTAVHTMRVNCNPIAKYTFSPANPKPGQSITFDASGAHDPDGRIMRYEWDWNNDGRLDYSAFSPRATHSFTRQGTYKAVLKVTDDNRATATAVQRIPVENPPKPFPTPPEDWENKEEVDEYSRQIAEYLFEEYPTLTWTLVIIMCMIGVIGMLTSE